MSVDKATAAYWAERNKREPFNCKANRKWGKEAAWIHGEGPFASVCFCPHGGSYKNCLTIQLYNKLEAVVSAQKKLMCGGNCQDISSGGTSEWHQIWDMSNRGYKRLDKKTLYPAAKLEAAELEAKLERDAAPLRRQLLAQKMQELCGGRAIPVRVLAEVAKETRAIQAAQMEEKAGV